MKTKTDIEQLRAEFEAWAIKERIAYRGEKHGICFYNGERNSYWIGYQAGRAALQSQDREDVKRPVLDSIVDEIHRRADKEWADDGYDFEVTITADEYKALCEEEKAIDHARRIEGD